MSAAAKSADPVQYQPYSIEVEQSLLGALLLNNKLIDVAAADLEGHHFYDPLHRRLYEMIVYLITEGDVTPIILNAVMKSDPGLVELGGTVYLASLVAAAPALPRVREFVSILLELAYRRELIAISDEMREAALEPPGEASSAQKVADMATEALLQAGRAIQPPSLSPYESALESMRECERMAQGKGSPMVKTGLEKVDEELGGLRGGDLVIAIAKSGQGKSALMGGISLNTSRAGVPTLVFSLEMRRAQWVERMVCDLDYDAAMGAGQKAMWYSRIRNGRLNTEEFDRYYIAAQRLDKLPMEIVETDELTVQQIQSRARAFKAKWGKNPDGSARMGLIVVDYLQIIEPTDPRDNRERQVAKIARGLKSLAKRMDWPVLAGSQMNENDTSRSKEEKRPQASDARESKAIMNEADIMLSPFRPAYFAENRKPMDALPTDPEWTAWKEEVRILAPQFELLMLKNRHGRRVDFDLHCEIGASAIRDHAPWGAMTTVQKNQADLLEKT